MTADETGFELNCDILQQCYFDFLIFYNVAEEGEDVYIWKVVIYYETKLCGHVVAHKS